MKRKFPMIAVGADELGEALGDTILCPHCKKTHPITNGKSKDKDGNWVESTFLQAYKCGKKTYLAGMNGRKISRLNN